MLPGARSCVPGRADYTDAIDWVRFREIGEDDSMNRSLLIAVISLMGAFVVALPLRASAESTGTRRVVEIALGGNGDVFVKLEGWTCSNARDFVYLPVSLASADKMLSIFLAAFLARRPVAVDFARSPNGLQCNLEGLIIN
jgi:hypothetical protein